MGLFAAQMKQSKVLVFVVSVTLLAVACGSKSGNKATTDPKPTPDPLAG